MLLKVVLLAYSRGIVSSRAIERACREHVSFIALSGDPDNGMRARAHRFADPGQSRGAPGPGQDTSSISFNSAALILPAARAPIASEVAARARSRPRQCP